jgi:hypothetical protein
MKIMTLLISTFLTWAAFDSNVFRRRKDSYALSETEISFSLGTDTLRQKEKIHRDRLDVIPAWHRGAIKPVRTKCNYFLTKSRDLRDSDQKKIRRRFDNM